MSKKYDLFICHASEDKDSFVRPLRLLVGSQKISSSKEFDTFFDQWEIAPGDSIRQKIDAGLAGCTHFFVLLTLQSLPKPWVNAEIDAAFIRKLEGQCKFIPLRQNLSVDALPPLLKALYSPYGPVRRLARMALRTRHCSPRRNRQLQTHARFRKGFAFLLSR